MVAMHILFLTDNFPPEVNAPASRTFEHCREWVNSGHKVTVITGVPNFPKGRVFDGYKNSVWQTEEMDGIRVIRVKTYIAANQGFTHRIIDYVSFMISAIFAAFFVRGVDIIIGTSPQFFTICSAYIVSRLKRAPYIFELRDIWPESIKAVGAMRDGFILRRLEWLEMFLYRKAARIVSVTNAFKSTLVERGIDTSKIHVITNGVDLSRFKPREKDPDLVAQHNLQGKFVAGYIGTHGMAHALETVLQAADQIRKRADGERYHILFLGDGARKQALVEQANAMDLDNVLFVETVPKEYVAQYWSLLDVSIIHLRKTELFATVIPSKLFETMGMGIPLLHGVKGESADIVEGERIGLLFEPENADDLCNGLTRLKNEPDLYEALRLNCLTSARHYDRKNLALGMLTILEETVSLPQPATSKADANKWEIPK